MRHAVFGRKFSRTKNERRRLFQGLIRDLIIRGSIKTTLAKAKAVQPLAEKLVTKAKKGDRTSRIQLGKVIDHDAIEKQLLNDAKTRFGSRQSGFTRIIKLGVRTGDAVEEVLLQFVDERVVAEVVAPKSREAGSRSARKEEKKAVKAKPAKAPARKRGRPKKMK